MSVEVEQQLFTKILSFKHDPEGFINYAFPWGEMHTDLHKFKGLKKWQSKELKRITAILKDNAIKVEKGLPSKVIYLAIVSGRGNGKSAFISMLNLWFMSCWFGATAVISANTEVQLRSKTMAELGKWHGMMINAHWFDKTGITLSPSKWFTELLSKQLKIDKQYYYCQGLPWSKENPDAFAGLHSQRGMFLTFDEASGIDDNIWDVSEGFFSDLSPIRMWIVMSNGRKSTGRFYDCFHKRSERWLNTSIDIREVEGIDHAFADTLVSELGEDNDTVRVEVRGMFPSTGEDQFIGADIVDMGMTRELSTYNKQALVMGVDVARFGRDDSVIAFRQGRDARSIPFLHYNGLDSMQLVKEVIKYYNLYKVQMVFVDGNGLGSGVVDRLRELRYKVVDVQFGGSGSVEVVAGKKIKRYLNKRAELWSIMKQWIKDEGCIKGEQLQNELTSPTYGFNDKGLLKIESKVDMAKRGAKSPDEADALCLTFDRVINPVVRNTSQITANFNYKVL